MVKRKLSRIIITLAVSVLIFSSAGMVTAAVTTQQEDINREKDYPIIIQPTGVLPADIPSIAHDDKRFESAVEGSVHIVSINLKPLQGKSDRPRKVQLWLGYDVGYLTVKLDRRRQGLGGTIIWSGNILNHPNRISLVFDGQGKMEGIVTLNARNYRITSLRDTSLHVVYEIDYSKFPGFHCEETKRTPKSREEQIEELKRKNKLPPDFEFPTRKKRSPKSGEK